MAGDGWRWLEMAGDGGLSRARDICVYDRLTSTGHL